MCGIYITTKKQSNEKIKKIVSNRGLDYNFELVTENYYCFSGILEIRESYRIINNDDFVLLYNGEMYDNSASDTKTLHNYINQSIKDLKTYGCKNKIKKQNDDETCNTDNCFCLITNLLSYLTCEYEAALIIVYKDSIYFFKDELGRKSLCYSFDKVNIEIASVGQTTEVSPHLIYKFNYKRSILVTKPRKKLVLGNVQHVKYDYSNLCVNKLFVKIIQQKLNESIQKRLHASDPIVLFSGGVDSLLIAVLLHMHSNIEKPIYLINTMFGDNKESHDRKICQIAYAELTRMCKNRRFVLIKNNVDYVTLNTYRNHIKELTHPKTSVMDFNIGACLWFSAKAAKEYGKIVYAGCGADELFCGYKNHKDVLSNVKNRINEDIANLWERNLGRDDRVISDNNVEPRFPFLDLGLVNTILGAPDHIFIDKENNNIGNKVVIREILKELGFVESCTFAKKAMQFGSGIKQFEKSVDN